jgi:Flp pilus assembly protein TadG
MARRLVRNRQGSAAVEFALIAGPFFLVLFAILEAALMFFAQQALETATQDTARMIMTGEAKSYTQTQFTTALCTRLATFFDCTGIRVASQSFANFAAITPFSPVDSSGNFVANFPYSTGASGTIMLVQVSYKWPLFVTGLGFNMANANGDSTHRLLTATAAFRNEPY